METCSRVGFAAPLGSALTCPGEKAAARGACPCLARGDSSLAEKAVTYRAPWGHKHGALGTGTLRAHCQGCS